jgi:hypothetical protein
MMQHPENIPTSWTATDDDFFRTTWDAFSTEFLAGAGVLLASYDAEQVLVMAVAQTAFTQRPVTAPARVTT